MDSGALSACSSAGDPHPSLPPPCPSTLITSPFLAMTPSFTTITHSFPLWLPDPPSPPPLLPSLAVIPITTITPWPLYSSSPPPLPFSLAATPSIITISSISDDYHQLLHLALPPFPPSQTATFSFIPISSSVPSTISLTWGMANLYVKKCMGLVIIHWATSLLCLYAGKGQRDRSTRL